MTTLLIKNIGEFFTGDLANPKAPVRTILIEDGHIAALDPPEAGNAERIIDADSILTASSLSFSRKTSSTFASGSSEAPKRLRIPRAP